MPVKLVKSDISSIPTSVGKIEGDIPLYRSRFLGAVLVAGATQYPYEQKRVFFSTVFMVMEIFGNMHHFVGMCQCHAIPGGEHGMILNIIGEAMKNAVF